MEKPVMSQVTLLTIALVWSRFGFKPRHLRSITVSFIVNIPSWSRSNSCKKKSSLKRESQIEILTRKRLSRSSNSSSSIPRASWKLMDGIWTFKYYKANSLKSEHFQTDNQSNRQQSLLTLNINPVLYSTYQQKIAPIRNFAKFINQTSYILVFIHVVLTKSTLTIYSILSEFFFTVFFTCGSSSLGLPPWRADRRLLVELTSWNRRNKAKQFYVIAFIYAIIKWSLYKQTLLDWPGVLRGRESIVPTFIAALLFLCLRFIF